MDAAAELGRNPVSKHQIQPEYGDEQTDAGRDGWTRLARPNSLARTGTGGYSFSLFSWPRAGLATLPGWSILRYMWWPYIHTYIHTYMRVIRWLPDTSPFLVSGLNAWTVVYVCCARGGSGNRRPDIARGDHAHLACLLLPYVIFHCSSSSTSRWITVSCTFWRYLHRGPLVSILNPNYTYFPLLILIGLILLSLILHVEWNTYWITLYKVPFGRGVKC